MAQTQVETIKVLIIGSGIGGLSAAKTYLQLDPSTDILILDAKASLGGVWAKESCYPDLKTNNLLGTYEFSDFPMDKKYGVETEQHIPGITLHQNCTDYAVKFDLIRYLRLNTKVTSAEKVPGGWKVIAAQTIADTAQNEIEYRCQKLMVSTGLSSSPKPIASSGQENFGEPIFHQGQLIKEAPRLLKDPYIERIAVLGGSKSAYDSVHLFASNGKKVEWVIRESGHGPTWMAPPHIYLGPMRCWLEKLTTTRFLTWFSPCIWGDADGYGQIRAALHGTTLGRFIVDKFWNKLRSDIVDVNGYRKDPMLAGLEPDESLFWTATSLGILNYDTPVYQYVHSGQVTVHRKDISELTEGTVNFTDGTKIKVDAMSQVTGWEYSPTVSFEPAGIDGEIGVPSLKYTFNQEQFWNNLDIKADGEIFARFPILKKAPQINQTFNVDVSNAESSIKIIEPTDQEATRSSPQQLTPYRLYRGIAPPGLTADGDRSLVFLKMVSSTSNMIIAELQALWSYAYLEGELAIRNDTVKWQTALASRFGKRRYPCGFGAIYPDFVFDSVPYADLLMRDLGLQNRRKSNVFKEIFEGYSIHDYKGIIDEWILSQHVTKI